ncbi:hypothetical protein [Conexibacter arvalis]|uniref:Ribbon-helix-helix domain-containing protein n=1 Tax=Conexibacter arvalis TaxID=912552 RepID=A0A840I993_9ACTN|nr:hypothetical protein [Conexibacter arvalis]MBB4661436.1 hypothetical protein [Conexibacter arvalis]
MTAPGTLHTTTARFDAEMWAAIEHHSHRLGIAHAEFIRGAVHHRLVHLDHTDRLTRLEQRVEAVADRGERMARVVGRLARGAQPHA